MSQFRLLALASCLSALTIATPAARAAATVPAQPGALAIKVVDRLANPVPSEDVAPRDDQSDPGMDPRDDLPPADEMMPPDVNDDSGSDMLQPPETVPDSSVSPNPPAISNDKGNGQYVLPQDGDDGN